VTETRSKLLGYELRSATAAIRLGTNMLSIGRSIECHVVFDSVAVSRRHAEVGLENGEPVVVDLASANGVFVNGQRIRGKHRLTEGDIVVIGDQKLRLGRVSLVPSADTRATLALTLPGVPGSQSSDSEESTNLEDAIALVSGVAQKLIDKGSPGEAREVLGPRLVHVLERARSNKGADARTVEAAALGALLLARGAQDPNWLDYVVLLHDATGKIMSDPVIEGMHQTVRRVPRMQLALLRDYIARMQDSELSTHERFLLRRLAGLERVAAGR
jgi:hypothetical protein